jgi:hypothetical protein
MLEIITEAVYRDRGIDGILTVRIRTSKCCGSSIAGQLRCRLVLKMFVCVMTAEYPGCEDSFVCLHVLLRDLVVDGVVFSVVVTPIFLIVTSFVSRDRFIVSRVCLVNMPFDIIVFIARYLEQHLQLLSLQI